MADKCLSAGKTGPTGGGHPADCEILDCGVHCAPPSLIESHECDGKRAITKLVGVEAPVELEVR